MLEMQSSLSQVVDALKYLTKSRGIVGLCSLPMQAWRRGGVEGRTSGVPVLRLSLLPNPQQRVDLRMATALPQQRRALYRHALRDISALLNSRPERANLARLLRPQLRAFVQLPDEQWDNVQQRSKALHFHIGASEC